MWLTSAEESGRPVMLSDPGQGQRRTWYLGWPISGIRRGWVAEKKKADPGLVSVGMTLGDFLVQSEPQLPSQPNGCDEFAQLMSARLLLHARHCSARLCSELAQRQAVQLTDEGVEWGRPCSGLTQGSAAPHPLMWM